MTSLVSLVDAEARGLITLITRLNSVMIIINTLVIIIISRASTRKAH